MKTEQTGTITFSIFGSTEVLQTPAEDGKNIMELLKDLGLYPDDYIVTRDSKPLPIDSLPEHNDYTLYRVPSGG